MWLINKKHENLTSIEYFSSEKNKVIQLADVLANFLMNSIRFKYFRINSKNNLNLCSIEDIIKYEKKYDFLLTHLRDKHIY